VRGGSRGQSQNRTEALAFRNRRDFDGHRLAHGISRGVGQLQMGQDDVTAGRTVSVPAADRPDQVDGAPLVVSAGVLPWVNSSFFSISATRNVAFTGATCSSGLAAHCHGLCGLAACLLVRLDGF
jgi:hypothetical protein